MAILLVVAVVGLVAAAVVVVSPADGVPSSDPVDAVVALAGERERLDVAEGIAEATGGALVVSWVPRSDPERDEHCEDDRAETLCFLPYPVSTAGEARAIGRLSAEHGWQRIVVVTSRSHVGRAQLLVSQCVEDAEVRVASAVGALGPVSVVQESAGVLVGLTALRAC